MRVIDVVHEEQRKRADERIHSNLCQQTRKDRTDGDRRGVIRHRQPEEQRKDGRFNAEGYQKQHRDGGGQTGLRHLLQANRDVCHV